MIFGIMSCLQHYMHCILVFHYLTLRAIMGALTSLIISLFFSGPLIHKLRSLQIGQSIRQDGPKTHLSKSGTPTMGGVLIVLSTLLSMGLWADWTNFYIWVIVGVFVLNALVGGWDDYLKVVRKNSDGISAGRKFLSQSVIAFLASLVLYGYAATPAETALYFPFFKHVAVPLGVWFVVLSWFVVVGSSNAVNLTDGLDGLAAMPTVLVMLALGVFAYLSGNEIFSKYLLMPHLPGVGELVVFSGSIVGAGLGFLWFNAYPAQVFMGDVGSLSLGAALGMVAVMVRQEIVFCIMGGVFVIETLSVILQVASFKLTGKRIFKMAPLHHHFELKGWPEPKIIVRFWIVTFVLVLFGLASLKLR